MYRIEIYYNKQGELTLAQYEDEERLSGRCRGENVKKCLSSITKEKIEKVFPSGEDVATVVYDGAYINLRNIDKLENDPLMEDYLSIVEKALKEQQKARASTVSRKNKHQGPLAMAVTGVFIALALSIMSGAAFAPDDIEETKAQTSPIGIHQEGEMPSLTSLTDVVTFETPNIEEITPEEFEKEDYAYLEYNDRSDSEKLHTAADLYWETIEKYANTYGLDPELVLALATQERGVHSSKKDPGGATGLMQIQNGVWLNEEVTAFNFDTGTYEKYKVTQSRIENCETNIKIGCMILQDMIHDKNYNILAGVLSYNLGGQNVNKILAAYSEATGISRSEILSNQTNCAWLEHRDMIKVGDPNYLHHVFSYLGPEFQTYVMKPDGTKIEINIKNYDSTKTVTR